MPARLEMDHSISGGGLDLKKYLFAILMWKHVRTALYVAVQYYVKVQNVNQKFKIQPKGRAELILKLRPKIKDVRKKRDKRWYKRRLATIRTEPELAVQIQTVPVPLVLRGKVETELDRLQTQEVIKPVEHSVMFSAIHQVATTNINHINMLRYEH